MDCRGGRGASCRAKAGQEDGRSEDELSSSADAVSAGAASDHNAFSSQPDAVLRFPLRRFLFLRPRSRSIVLLAPLVRLLATMVLAATELAEEIPPIRIPRMRQEANATVAAVDRTACQTGMIAQDGIQRDLILTNKRTNEVVLMPIRAKRKEFPDTYDKNTRFSVKMLIVFCTPSSYELDADAARSRARFFIGLHQIEAQRTGATA